MNAKEYGHEGWGSEWAWKVALAVDNHQGLHLGSVDMAPMDSGMVAEFLDAHDDAIYREIHPGEPALTVPVVSWRMRGDLGDYNDLADHWNAKARELAR